VTEGESGEIENDEVTRGYRAESEKTDFITRPMK